MKKTKQNKKVYMIFGRLIIIIIVFAISVTGGYAYVTPTSYVNLYVDSSIEYTLNAFDKVISVIAVNEDVNNIIYNLDLKNTNINIAIQETVDELLEKGYISDIENINLIIEVDNSNENKVDDLIKKLQEETQMYIDEKDEILKVEIKYVEKVAIN